MALINKHVLLLMILAVAGCDTFPGPVLRNEFPSDIRVSVLYEDGGKFSEVWPSCRVVAIGAADAGLLGAKDKGVSIERIVITVDNNVIHSFDKVEVKKLIQKADEKYDYPIWVLEPSGIRFTNQYECSN
jgi:hypothetical protein